VFSLAIVLYELLAGKYIVPRGDAVAAMRMIRDGKIEPLDKVAPHVPPPLVKAIKWALEPKRENRATAADFAQALESYIKSSPELATSMQLATWIRKHFTREVTDEHKAVSPGTHAGPGTLASPGTAVAPGTAAVPATAASIAVTPPVYPPRRFVKLLNDTAEGTEIYSASDLEEESAETIKGPRKPPDFSQMARAESAGELAEDTIDLPSRRKVLTKSPAADKATVVVAPDAEETVAGAPPVVGGRPAPDEEDSENVFETIEHDHRVPVPSGPTVVPTRVQPAAMPSLDNPFAPSIGSSPPAGLPALPALPSMSSSSVMSAMPARPSMGLASRKKRQKMLVMVAGLSGLALLSFMIALAASSGPAPAKRQDAGVAITPIPIDSQIVVTPLPTIDAAPATTIPTDAATMGDAYLEVRTIPDGGTIRVGDQTRETSESRRAQLVLPAGRHSITAELAGYSSEKRDIVLLAGEHQSIEIAFTKKLQKPVDRGQPMGRLTVRTTPWSDVYLGGKKLGQAPFADLELPAGTHTLTFKNPSRPQVTKTVKIIAGKSTKLNFNLP
jgi:serine/threonine-protein kinase